MLDEKVKGIHIGKQLVAIQVIKQSMCNDKYYVFVKTNISYKQLSEITELSIMEIELIDKWCHMLSKDAIAEKVSSEFSGDWLNEERIYFELVLLYQYENILNAIQNNTTCIPITADNLRKIFKIMSVAYDIKLINKEAQNPDTLNNLYNTCMDYINSLTEQAISQFDIIAVQAMLNMK